MTKTFGYNQCNTVLIDNNCLIDNYQTDVRYLNVDLNLVKNEPIDSVEYLQQLNESNQQRTFHYVQQNQQISPQLPPTPPSESTIQIYKIETNNNQFINQQNQMNQQMNQMNSTNQIDQTNQINQQIKNHPTYLPASGSINKQKQLDLNQSTNNQQVGKYRKTKSKLHNTSKFYNHTSNEQMNRNQMKSTNSISRRNERERKRVRNVNIGFQKLRDRIPNAEKKKLSKAETLKSAARYIRQLLEILGETNESTNNSDYLFSIVQQDASLNAISESSNISECQTISNQIIDQSNSHSSSSLDYIDLAELLSQ